MLVIDHESYPPGVIGLVAGKLVEKYYRPTIVISADEKLSKGSARSVSGFHITDAIRKGGEYLEDFGGHPMAAGFSIRRENIKKFREKMLKHADKTLSKKDLMPILKIDTRLKSNNIDSETLSAAQEFEPHGIGNPEPVFLTENLKVLESRTVGADGKHLKLILMGPDRSVFDAICFSFQKEKPEKGSVIDSVYNLMEDTWQGQKRLQLKVRDFRKSGGLV
jgi:single-stranded-DNA-specific exonuclease